MGGRSVQPVLLLLLLLLLLARMSQLWAFPFSPSLDLDVTPRTTVFSKGGAADSMFYIFKTEARADSGSRVGS